MDVGQIAFIILFLLTFGFFGLTASRIFNIFKKTKPTFRLDRIPERITTVLLFAIGQRKMFKRPVAGTLHALVFWGFIMITVGTIEYFIDGLAGTHRIMQITGPLYDVIMASGELFALIIIIACVIFLSRRYITKPARFEAPEMKPSSRMDATVVLFIIMTLMVSLLAANMGDIQYHMLIGEELAGAYPVSRLFMAMGIVSGIENADTAKMVFSVGWWVHIVLVCGFLNLLPFSKHFHVLLSLPNVFFTRLEAYAKLDSMESVTKEVKAMMDPEMAFAPPPEGEPAELPSFGVKDADDVAWKTLMDSYTCTECGRCTAVCPANTTGKLLSPRKLYIDLRARMTEIAGYTNGDAESDNKKLVGDYISEEELWACTTCMACIEECPVNIDHVPFIVDMRRNLVMEESKAPQELIGMFTNIENNGAPWQFSAADRMNWAEGLEVPTMAEMQMRGEDPEVLFWVGCSGAFDDRNKKITRAFAQILNESGTKYAVLGEEESCTGDPAKRAGNEFLAQMQAMQNIEVLNAYGVKKIVATCPHCFNALLNEYPDLGGYFEVMHHSQFLQQLIDTGKIKMTDDNQYNGKSVTYHDSCYIGRGNGIYEAPRSVIESLKADVREMKKSKKRGMCCGAGGAQMFKEEENGTKRVNTERTEHAIETGAEVIATACPFCMTMMSDGVKEKEKENIKVLDIAELIAEGKNLV